MRRATIVTFIPASLLSITILICAGHFNVVQAQDSATKSNALGLACGKELQNRCSNVAVHANNMLECLQNEQEKVSTKCTALANNVVRRCERDAVQLCQGMVAGGGNTLGCLTAAKGSVSARCNAALDAAFLRQ